MLFGWTEHDRDLSIDLSDGDGATTYAAARGVNRSALKTSAGLNVDEVDMEGFFDASGITKADLRAGRWDACDIRVFMVNWADTSQGVIKLRRGRLGRLTNADDVFKVEVRSLWELYNQELVRLYHPGCPVDLGSATTVQGGGCGMRTAPPSWAPTTAYTVRAARDAASGSVVKPSTFNDRHFKCTTAGTSGGAEPAWNLTIGGATTDGTVVWTTIRALTIEGSVDGVTSNREFSIISITDAPDALFTGGLLTWTSGLNNGLKFEVAAFGPSPLSVTLFLPTPFAIAGGTAGSPNDSFTISAGCDKSTAVCKATYDNILNYQGFPHIPGNDEVFRTPDAPN